MEILGLEDPFVQQGALPDYRASSSGALVPHWFYACSRKGGPILMPSGGGWGSKGPIAFVVFHGEVTVWMQRLGIFLCVWVCVGVWYAYMKRRVGLCVSIWCVCGSCSMCVLYCVWCVCEVCGMCMWPPVCFISSPRRAFPCEGVWQEIDTAWVRAHPSVNILFQILHAVHELKKQRKKRREKENTTF